MNNEEYRRSLRNQIPFCNDLYNTSLEMKIKRKDQETVLSIVCQLVESVLVKNIFVV